MLRRRRKRRRKRRVKKEDSDDLWRLLIEETFERCQSEFDERVTEHMAGQRVDEGDARKQVYDNMLPTYRKASLNVFVDEMLRFHVMKKDYLLIRKKHDFRIETSRRLRQ